MSTVMPASDTPRLLVVDNYDSFTWNLVHLVSRFTRAIEVVRNDVVSADAILDGGFDAIVLSPGPCTPNEAGVCLEVVEKGAGRVPIFGVCLGLQTIGQAFGGAVVRAPLPMHGKTSRVQHTGTGLFAGCVQDFTATRYHSLVVDRDTCPDVLEVTAHTRDGQIMAASHRTLPVHGVQFHPESILSEHGETILGNFVDLARAWRNG
ncbi:anthranilate synthase component II [Salinarimonas chemoclinalis]|uniref:anthranilate synthase component II n=1 Tax=Salinarimonas chemoclinalis TaxID=3241599 RepID=UPI0035584CF5